MAVFTPVSLAQCNAWLLEFDLPAADRITGIESGIENSNFFVQIPDHQPSQWVLTLLEKIDASLLPFYLEWITHLAHHGLPVPQPVRHCDGQLFAPLNHKPAVLMTRLLGQSDMAPSAARCQQLGQTLARMHLISQSFQITQINPRGFAWCQATAPAIESFLDHAQQELLAHTLREWEQLMPHFMALPQGAVHLDLFRNNVLFTDDQLSGIFDFYFGGVDCFAYDLAIALNDWACIDPLAGLDSFRAQALLQGYQAIRPLSVAEQQSLAPFCRAAALRFWLSRLYDFHLPRSAALLTPHDPSHFEHLLRAHHQLQLFSI